MSMTGDQRRRLEEALRRREHEIEDLAEPARRSYRIFMRDLWRFLRRGSSATLTPRSGGRS